VFSAVLVYEVPKPALYKSVETDSASTRPQSESQKNEVAKPTGNAGVPAGSQMASRDRQGYAAKKAESDLALEQKEKLAATPKPTTPESEIGSLAATKKVATARAQSTQEFSLTGRAAGGAIQRPGLGNTTQGLANNIQQSNVQQNGPASQADSYTLGANQNAAGQMRSRQVANARVSEAAPPVRSSEAVTAQSEAAAPAFVSSAPAARKMARA
jgi:hypothetical protein